MELSVIVATHNGGQGLRACLEALSHQSLPPTDYEVIVVVDGSTDGTERMLTDLVTPFALQISWQEHAGRAAACNRGVQEAAGRYCLFLEDDITADRQLLAEHVRVQHEYLGVIGIGGVRFILPPRAHSLTCLLAEAWQEYDTSLEEGLRTPSFLDCYSGNMSVPRSFFLAAGGFVVDLPRSYDVELGYRLQRQGLSVVYMANASGCQNYRKNFQEILGDAELAAVELYERYPEMLPYIPLAAFSEGSIKLRLLRELALITSAPVGLLALLGQLLRNESWRRRWWGILYNYCYWRGVQRVVRDRDTWQQLTRGPVFLAYHAVGGVGDPASPYVVPARRFARQMGWLKRRQYRVISLKEFLRYYDEHRMPPSRSVIITFDDGYADNRTIAYPILRQHGFSATIFLVTGAVGSTNQWDRHSDVTGRLLLSWADAREMTQGDIDFGAHSRSHASLPLIESERAREETEGSWMDLKQRLDDPLGVFAYPYGEADATSRALVERAGFRAACGVRPGMNGPEMLRSDLRRVEIFGTDSLIRFILALRLGVNRAPKRSRSVLCPLRHGIRRA